MRFSGILILSALFTACHKIPDSASRLNIQEIESVSITKHHHRDSFPVTPRTVKYTDIRKFAEDWNNAKSKGMCKYLSGYSITVYFKDKTQRSFNAQENLVQYRDDECFVIGEKDYFEKIWLSNRPVCPKVHTNLIIPIVYGLPTKKAVQQASANKIMLGGCDIDLVSPQWHCTLHLLSF